MISKNQRLGRKLFAEVWKGGKRTTSLFFSVVYLVNADFPSSRFAVVVPKKVEKLAVTRNKIRRFVYSSLKKSAPQLGGVPMSVVLVAKGAISGKTHKEIGQDVENICRKIASSNIEKVTNKA